MLLRIRSAHLGIFGFLKQFAPLIQQYFCEVYDYVKKADLREGYQNPKKKIGGNHPHFSFWTSIILAKIYFLPIAITFANYTSLLGGTVLKPHEKHVAEANFVSGKHGNVSESSQKHFCFTDANFASETYVSQFCHPRKHCWNQCFHNNVS